MQSTLSKFQPWIAAIPMGLVIASAWIQPQTAFAEPVDQALFITNYECGPPKMELKDIEDLACHAFTVTDTSWSLEKALTVSASVPVFSRSIEDISPELKGHLFVGLDTENRLTIYDGNPKDGRVLQRLDQVSLPALQRAVPHSTLEQLQNGIYVKNIEEYRSVLSTFLRYSNAS